MRLVGTVKRIVVVVLLVFEQLSREPKKSVADLV
jgi:hypothetical protein